jgi:uncharacterized membrane protein YraQ (UPF0718 family)
LSGFIITFLIQYLVPKKIILQNFGKNNIKNLFKSAFVGLFLSSFSYGAVPVIAYMRKRDSTTANCLTMLLASPWAGLSQLIILGGYTGWFNALILLISSLIVALFSGLLISYFEKNKLLDEKKRITRTLLKKCDCQEGDNFIQKDETKETFDLFIAVSKNIFLSLLITALIKTVLTPNDVTSLLGGNIKSIIISLPLATVFEAIGEGLAVLGGELFTLGASLGSVFVIMMVGVITDVYELTMLDTVFGRRTTSTYIIINTIIVSIVAVWLNLLL